MRKEPKVYQGLERDQVFVKRYERNPSYGGKDNRKYRTTAQWMYCVKRHQDYWRDQGDPDRGVPDYRVDGEEGWWFPAVWIVDFAEMNQRPSCWPQQQGEAA